MTLPDRTHQTMNLCWVCVVFLVCVAGKKIVEWSMRLNARYTDICQHVLLHEQRL